MHLTWQLGPPRMNVLANKAEAAMALRTQPLKPRYGASAICYGNEAVTTTRDSRGGDADTISQWEEHERIFYHVLKPPLSYFWYTDS